MKLDDLVIGKFYYFKINHEAIWGYYFKFAGYDDRYVYHYNYHIIKTSNNSEYKFFIGNKFAFISDFENSIYYEIPIILIIDYLPDTNIDKNAHFRKIKTDYLLSIWK